jgi:hypothetical protein
MYYYSLDIYLNHCSLKLYLTSDIADKILNILLYNLTLTVEDAGTLKLNHIYCEEVMLDVSFRDII